MLRDTALRVRAWSWLPCALLLCVATRPAPGAPTADAGPDLTAETGAQVTLDGSRSASAAGLTYRWTQVTAPDVTDRLEAFECPADWADDYGTRVRGYLHPPATGDYTFWIASDDAGELWLSTDDSPERLRRIAFLETWTPPREWERFPAQTSAPIALEAGRVYYIEALHKEGGGNDHLAVAWSGPRLEQAVIAGRFLSPELDAPAGSITREVWRRLPGEAVADLTASARYPGGRTAVLTGADQPRAQVAAELGGRYEFELAVSEGAQAATDRVAVLVTDPLVNGDFEAGEGDRPAAWEPPADAPGVTFRWEEHGGIGDSRCISISSTDPTQPAAWRQRLQLAPYAPYLLKGYIRGAGLAAKGNEGATIGLGNLWISQNGPARTVSDLDWTPFEVDFATDPSGRADIECKLGYMFDGSSGTAYFDNLTVERNPDVETFEGQHFVLHLYRDEVELATRAGVERMMANVDAVCEAYKELTGYDPGGEDRQSAWAPDKWPLDALGWSGNPLLWTGDRDWIKTNWPREGYCAEVFLHELAHNYDHPNFMFHTHFNELKMYYALETLDLGIAEDGWTRGAETRHRWEVRTQRNRELGIIDEGVQTYKNTLIRDQIGWEPFKRTFRYFLALPPDQVPPTPWGKFKLWHDKLSEFSGWDCWSVYTPEELQYVREYYTPRPEVASLPEVSALPADTTSVSLTEVRWQSAEVGWESPAYSLQGSDTTWHSDSIYAHAPSRYVYDPAGGWTTLRTAYGLARGCPGSVVFVVRGDGRELFRSELITDPTEREAEVDVSGVQELELIVEDGGNGRTSDHGVWFGPHLER